MSEINEVSRKLLSEGWRKEQTPPGMKPWDSFYGGWTYHPDSRRDVVFAAPCGLLFKRTELSYSGTMYFMGVDWTEENDRLTTLCPRYERSDRCEVNDPLLEDQPVAGSHYEKLCYCAVHETKRAWSYEQSAQKVKDEAERRREERWEAFRESRGGHVCRTHCHYNRKNGEWRMRYDPQRCTCGAGAFCPVLGKTLSEKRGNVFYDLKKTWTVKGDGLFPDEQRCSITRGIKLLTRTEPMTICEAIAKTCKEDLQWRVQMKHHMEMFFGQIDAVEVFNIRAEAKAGRDLQEDLRSIAEGVEIVHEADRLKAAEQSRHDQRAAAQSKRRDRLEKLLREKGWGELSDYERRRVRKALGPEEIRRVQTEREKALKEKDAGVGQNISLFEGL